MEITTIKDLNEYKGKYLAFESRGYNFKCVWIKKLTSVGFRYSSTYTPKSIPNSTKLRYVGVSEVDHLETFGIGTTEVFPKHAIYSASNKPYRTNAQTIIRIPTKEEMKIYQKIWRHHRVFGTLY